MEKDTEVTPRRGDNLDGSSCCVGGGMTREGFAEETVIEQMLGRGFTGISAEDTTSLTVMWNYKTVQKKIYDWSSEGKEKIHLPQ